jgi:hypothetical protein
MSDFTKHMKLQKQINKLETKKKQLEYDLSRAEHLLGESMVVLDQISKRAAQNKDSFTVLWCDTMLSDIRKTLDLPRFGVDVITWKQIRDERENK